MIRKIIFGLALVFSVMNAHAGYFIGDKKIIYLRAYDDYAVVTLSENGPNTDSCTRDNAGGWVAIDMSNDMGEAMYSALLAAHMASRRVAFKVSGCYDWGDSANSIPKAYRVDIYDD